MYILSRRPGEAVIIETSDGPVRVIFVGMKGPRSNKAKIGFECMTDKPVPIHVEKKIGGDTDVSTDDHNR